MVIYYNIQRVSSKIYLRFAYHNMAGEHHSISQSFPIGHLVLPDSVWLVFMQKLI